MMSSLFHNAEEFVLISSVLLFLSIFAGKAGYRLGIPALLLFLAIGMLSGSDGLGIHFNDPQLTQFVGMLALSIILFSGGMDTKYTEIKTVISQGVLLATIGVLITTFVTGTFIYFVSGLVQKYVTLTYPESLLLAAVMSSTDSASVFSILRSKGIYLKQRLRPMLELESGSNDPMAYMLTLLLIAYIQQGGMDIIDAIQTLSVQLILGTVIGYLLGKLTVYIVNRINIENESFYPLLLFATALFTFAATTLAGGNGYLAVYLAGLVVGNSKLIHKRRISTFFEGFAWLWQIVMFLTLGLLVNPHELLPIAGIGIFIGVFMILVARPISVFLSLLPFKSTTNRGKLYLSWVGLRGAVPIIFATYPLIAGLEHAQMIFNIVFFITILSLTIQGTTVTLAAHLMKLTDKPERSDTFGIELPDDIKSAMSEIELTPEILEHGNKLMHLALPDNTLVVMVNRDKSFFVPKGNTELKIGDKLLVISDNDKDLLYTYKLLGITDYTLKKNK